VPALAPVFEGDGVVGAVGFELLGVVTMRLVSVTGALLEAVRRPVVEALV